MTSVGQLQTTEARHHIAALPPFESNDVLKAYRGGDPFLIVAIDQATCVPSGALTFRRGRVSPSAQWSPASSPSGVRMLLWSGTLLCRILDAKCLAKVILAMGHTHADVFDQA